MSPTSPTAVGAALALLARRELSARQMRDRLSTCGFSRGAIEEAIARLSEQGALDDHRVALAQARRDATVKRYGPRRILQRLTAAGIDETTAGRAVREVLAEADESSTIERTAERWLSVRRRDLSDPAVGRRLEQHLIRRGFSPTLIQSFLRSRARVDRPSRAADLDE